MKKLTLLLSILCLAFGLNAQNCKGKSAALEVMGGTSGIAVYNTYLVVGLVADNYSEEVYDADRSTQLIDEQIGAIKVIEDQFKALQESGFLTDPSDVQYVKGIIDAFSLVKEEAVALNNYIDSGSQADLDDYSAAREEAWAAVKELLGIE